MACGSSCRGRWTSSLTPEIAALRARLEPLVEATQIKGDSEKHPFLSPDDEFADFETWDRSNLDGTEIKTKAMLRWEYSREALKTGLMLEKQLEIPFRPGTSPRPETNQVRFRYNR